MLSSAVGGGWRTSTGMGLDLLRRP
jgi:hypothetical protein